MIWAEPAADHPYSAPEYEPFWAAAQDLNMPLSLHILTGRGGTGPTEQSGMMFNLATIHRAIERTLVVMVYGGVLEKFPRLTIVSAENDVGWMAYLMYRLDTVQNRMGTLGGMKLPMRASDYIKRQVYATFIADPRIRRPVGALSGGQHHVVVRLPAYRRNFSALAPDRGQAPRYAAARPAAQNRPRHRGPGVWDRIIEASASLGEIK
jgi:hypothetical protein